MQDAPPTGCAEYRNLTRRGFLRAGGAAAIAATAPAWLPRVAIGRNERFGPVRDVLVSVFLRGGADGLTLCVPHADPWYYIARPTLAIPRPDSGDEFAGIDLDGFFGLPPAMAPLQDAFLAGHFLFVHATGSGDATRSHFEAMHYMEVGKPRDTDLLSGWLARHLLSVPPLDPQAAARAIGISPGLQRVLVGGPNTLAFPDLDDARLNGRGPTREERFTLIQEMYARAPDPLQAAAQTTATAMIVLDAIDFAGYTPVGGAEYPDSDLGYALKSTAALLKAKVGVEAIAIDSERWDTHETQGPTDGFMSRRMDDLARSLAAFHRDVVAEDVPVCVVIMSEFGRKVVENASLGTDHGHGNVMMLMGQKIAGGRVLSQWPGLDPDLLYEGQDLAVTIDYRDIIAEVVQRRLGNPDLPFVFPDYTPTFRGVTV